MVTFRINCPCCGQTVEATDTGFAATSVLVAACDTLRSRGVSSYLLRKSEAFALEVVGEDILVHKSGLVAFGG